MDAYAPSVRRSRPTSADWTTRTRTGVRCAKEGRALQAPVGSAPRPPTQRPRIGCVPTESDERDREAGPPRPLGCNSRLDGRSIRCDLRNPSTPSRRCAEIKIGVPKGIRTPVSGVKSRRPGPTRRWGRETARSPDARWLARLGDRRPRARLSPARGHTSRIKPWRAREPAPRGARSYARQPSDERRPCSRPGRSRRSPP